LHGIPLIKIDEIQLMVRSLSMSSKSCTLQRTKRYATRPSPPYPANAPSCQGTTKPGNDGNKWVSVPASNGVYRWISMRKRKTVTGKKPMKGPAKVYQKTKKPVVVRKSPSTRFPKIPDSVDAMNVLHKYWPVKRLTVALAKRLLMKNGLRFIVGQQAYVAAQQPTVAGRMKSIEPGKLLKFTNNGDELHVDIGEFGEFELSKSGNEYVCCSGADPVYVLLP